MTEINQSAVCRCGQTIPGEILEANPEIRICSDCRTTCIDAKVTDRGLAAIHAIAPIRSGEQYYCIRDYQPIEPARAAVGSILTCKTCQEHLDRLDQDRLRAASARTKVSAPRSMSAYEEGQPKGGVHREPRRVDLLR